MRKLIVNADDFGFNREITDGILLGHTQGCITSTTLMANMPAAEYAIEKAKASSKLSVGVHLNLSLGRPVLPPGEIPDLVDETGMFRNVAHLRRLGYRLQLPYEQIFRELSAQVQKCLDCGLQPSHLDSHHNVTVFPQVNQAMLDVATRHSISRLRTYKGWHRLDGEGRRWKLLPRWIRMNAKRSAVLLYYHWMDCQARRKGFCLPDAKFGFPTVVSEASWDFDGRSWDVIVRNLPTGITEFVTHPGMMSQDPLDRPEYRLRRVRELELFSNSETRRICDQHDVRLVNFYELNGES